MDDVDDHPPTTCVLLCTGLDVAGVVVAKGSAVTKFNVGDRVFGMLDFRRAGSVAELVATDESTVARIPTSVGYAEAAGMPLAGLTALEVRHYLQLRRCIQAAIAAATAHSVFGWQPLYKSKSNLC